MAVPLGEIARRAGVGAGTVYRHFPSKEALFRATVVDRVRLFTDTARELAEAPEPGRVFFRYLAAVVRLSARNKGLCDALEASAEGRFTPSPAVERDFRAALGVLLARAQRAGAVRRDVTIDDVMALLLGCLAMEQRGPARGTPGRMTALVCDGLRPGRNVTKLPAPAPPGRDETRARQGAEARESNETRCAVCDGALPAASRTGRPARYCGAACRQKAYRARRTAGVVLEPEVTDVGSGTCTRGVTSEVVLEPEV
ncbi:TetR/AcrR family transcriptional regulator [Streptomyces caatingaensis]|uniref:TetR/AcrR family transcriptional regulator n=1 Tax=Streptomyces caatingaensis TaxID=1678637 RepID=UPI001F52A83E